MTAHTQQTSSRRSWIRRAATATAIGAMAAVPTSAALAGEAIVGVDPTMAPVLEFPATPPQPTYQVKMVSFTADDESGWDWLGSDEPYFIMSSVGRDGTNQTDRTRVFGDVDSGDTRSFGASEGCVFPVHCGAAPAPDGIGVSIQLWEEDNGDLSANVAKTAEYFAKAGDIADYASAPDWVSSGLSYMSKATNYISGLLRDDLLGTRTLAYTGAQLTRRLPVAGSSFVETRYFGGLDTSGGADYYVQLRISRIS